MDVFLLRHAETASNRDGELTTGAGDALTERGRFQAQRIVKGLMDLNVESILCSPYPRALDTILPFAEASGLEIEVQPCLAEGQPVPGNAPAKEAPHYYRHESGHDFPLANETPEAFLGRVLEAHRLISFRAAARILVVSHGHMIRELLNAFLSLSSRTRFPHENCGLTHISLGDTIMVHFINRPL